MRRTDIHDLEIVSASIPYIDVKFKRSPNGRESTETVYVMDNGKIKCDPFGILHSALTLISCYMSLDNDDITQHQFWIEQLGKAGAPVDGYNTNDPESNEETLLRIKEWLIENLAKLDSTKLNTQQIPLSEADLKTVEAWLRVEIKRRA